MISSAIVFAMRLTVRNRLPWILVLSPWILAACGGDGGGGPMPGLVNSPPLITPIAPLVVSEGQRITLAPNASDPDGDLVNFTFSGWMTSSSRLATAADIGPQLVTITADDGKGGSDTLDVQVTVMADSNPNRAILDPAQNSPWSVPFPSDLFTLADSDMATGLRVNLPAPAAGLVSEGEDVQSANLLDGFSLFPRITLPFSGAVPEAATFTSGSIFLVALSPSERGRVIAIDQRLIDDSAAGAPRLIGVPENHLRESSRYALVVTHGLRAAGAAIRRPDALTDLLWKYESTGSPAGAYETEIFDALDALDSGILGTLDDLLTISVFTTRTVTDLPVKLLARLDSGAFTVTPPSFEVDGNPGREVFDAADIQSIDIFLHRASSTSDGLNSVVYSAGSLVRDVNGVGDWEGEVYVINQRTGTRLLVPQANTGSDGSVADTDITALTPQLGDELVLAANYRRFSTARLPYLWNFGVERVVFGAFDTPRYADGTGSIPVVKTGPGFLPAQTGSQRIVFMIVVPAGAKPLGGWPVAHYAHGGGGSFLDGGMFNAAAVLGTRGIATVAFSAPGHGGGIRTLIEVATSGGTVVIPDSGRAEDFDGDGQYEDDDKEGRIRHRLMQRISDVSTLVRSIQAGADFEADPAADITQAVEDTFVFGISFGGRTTTVLAAVEPRVSQFAANVPGAGGSRVNYGFYPRMAIRSIIGAWLFARTPILTNGPSPIWGGSFDEDIPVKGLPVQVGVVTGAEPIQRALDYALWLEQGESTAAYGVHVREGGLRGGPASYFLQIVRGDGLAINPMQWFLISSGGLENRTGVIRADNEPAFDAQYASVFPGPIARHILLAIPYSGFPGLDVGGHICHLARVQVADFLNARDTTVPDPDGAGTVFAGDVFQFPIPAAVLDSLSADPGF